MQQYFILVLFMAHLVLFASGWFIGKSFYKQSVLLQKLGRKTLKMKEKALAKNLFLHDWRRI